MPLQSFSILAAITLLTALGGCSTLGSIEERAERVNLASASYASSAILYNVLRASAAEPLDFVSMTGVTGHEGSSIGVGLPTIIVGPGRTPAQNLFLFGPNTVGASASNDFNINVVDDPASQQALLRPVDPATLGFLVNQGYNEDHIFFLFIEKIVDVDRASGRVVHSYYNEPYGYLQPTDNCPTIHAFGFDCHWPTEFYARLQTLLDHGLSVEVEPTFVPTQGGTGTARFCFDPDVTPGPTACRPALVAEAPSQPSQAQTVTGSIDQLAAQPGVKAPKSFAVTAKIMPPKKSNGPVTTFGFADPDKPGQDVYVYTRSVYGAYRYLGELLNVADSITGLPNDSRETARLFTDGGTTAGTRMLNLSHDYLGCWASVDYEGNHWCVPTDAVATKRTFQILHQLFRLFSSASNQPVTPTVRAIQ